MTFWRRCNHEPALSHSIRDYRALVRLKLPRMPEHPSLALAQSIGAPTMDDVIAQGDGHVAVLRHFGLSDGMAIYDVGCGCGRTAQALRRAGWQGHYTGPTSSQNCSRKSTGPARAIARRRRSTTPSPHLRARSTSCSTGRCSPASTPPNALLYVVEAARALKPGGRLMFSFLELEDPAHDLVWQHSLSRLRTGEQPEQRDVFLHRDWIRLFARQAGFGEVRFVDGADGRHHPPFWQAIAVLDKPA